MKNTPVKTRCVCLSISNLVFAIERFVRFSPNLMLGLFSKICWASMNLVKVEWITFVLYLRVNEFLPKLSIIHDRYAYNSGLKISTQCYWARMVFVKICAAKGRHYLLVRVKFCLYFPYFSSCMGTVCYSRCPRTFIKCFASSMKIGIVKAILEVNLNPYFPHLVPDLGAV